MALIKLDIKGAIPKALRGTSEIIRRHKPRLVLAADEFKEDPVQMRDVVYGFGLGYQLSCGACFVQDLRVRPHVLFFD